MGNPTGSYIIHAEADPAVGQLLAALDWRASERGRLCTGSYRAG